MDKLINFKTGAVGNLKSIITKEQNQQFYSEEEDNSKSKYNQSTKPNPSKFKASNNFEADGDTPKNEATQKQTKQSRFKQIAVLNNDGDDKPEEMEEFVQQPTNDNSQQQNYDQSIEEQLKRLNLKDVKTKKNIKHNENVNSDNEAVKKQKQDGNFLKTHPFGQLIYGTNIQEANFNKFLMLAQRGIVYSKKCLKGPSDKFIKSKQVDLPQPLIPKVNTLLLDLDETLIHSCQLKENPQTILRAYTENGEEVKIGLNVRPYCTQFFAKIKDYFDIYVYTASSLSYANAIIKHIDPNEEYILGVLTRSNCMETKNGFFIKDLRIIRNRDINRMLIVDNLTHSFGLQLDQGVVILEYHNDPNDKELLYIADYLIEAANAPNMLQFNKEKQNFDALAEAEIS